MPSRLLLLLAAMLPFDAAPTPTDHELAKLFGQRDACIEVVEAQTGHPLLRYNERRLLTRFSPCSTFKVPLAVMAEAHGLIDAHTVFKWDGKKREMSSWNHDQTPSSWLAESVVWVSQGLTPRLGRKTMAHDLASFQFGNANVAGDLTSFWLTGSAQPSLGISADEQFRFWRALFAGGLPTSPAAQARARGLLPTVLGANGALMVGKTGSGHLRGAHGIDPHRQLGWYVGMLASHAKSYVVVCNFTDQAPDATKGPAGPAARSFVETILKKMNLF